MKRGVYKKVEEKVKEYFLKKKNDAKSNPQPVKTDSR